MIDETCCDACGYPIHATKEMACDWCRQAADRIEALTEQLTAARQDAKEAEVYTEEVERELRDTQDRANAFATKEYYTEMRAERAETKLVKAVEALGHIAAEASVPVHTWKNGINFKKMYEGWRKIAVERIDIARATLAELKGESHD